jgi:hypothetical protein
VGTVGGLWPEGGQGYPRSILSLLMNTQRKGTGKRMAHSKKGGLVTKYQVGILLTPDGRDLLRKLTEIAQQSTRYEVSASVVLEDLVWAEAERKGILREMDRAFALLQKAQPKAKPAAVRPKVKVKRTGAKAAKRVAR